MDESDRVPQRRSLCLTRRGGVAVGVAIAAFVIVDRSIAAFSTTTTSVSNQIATATVTLADDDGGTALFNVAGLQPGATGSRCVLVTYTGSVAATVRLAIPSAGGALAPHLDLVIEDGTGGTASSCTAFVANTTLAAGSLATIAAAHDDFASGLGSFSPSGAGQQRSYRVTYTLDPALPPGLVGASASAVLQWEAQS